MFERTKEGKERERENYLLVQWKRKERELAMLRALYDSVVERTLLSDES